ncbi:hypothetical protein [Sciscionella marina]|uniref:hypothetical protein n=1 Tax=Sciscionella marina TaxID=508770 RepID=UPI0012F6F103|nr:hypothetical protein [Sciscionella marina]
MALFLVGRWGRRRVAGLVWPGAEHAPERGKRVRVARRGAMSCYVMAVVFAAFAAQTVILDAMGIGR